MFSQILDSKICQIIHKHVFRLSWNEKNKDYYSMVFGIVGLEMEKIGD